jgi:hypothetical protein
MEQSVQLHDPGRFTPGERGPDTHWIGNNVDERKVNVLF